MLRLSIFFRNNFLTILLAIVPPLGIYYFLQRADSSLNLSVVTKSAVVSLDSDYAENIKILYQNKPIESLFVTDLKVSNDGNQPIAREDFDSPITITFNGEVLNPVRVLDSTPQGLPVVVKSVGNLVEIGPLLMNPGDRFTIQARVVDSGEDISIAASARVKGVSELTFTPYSDQEENVWLQYLLGAVAAVIASLSVASIVRLIQEARLVRISVPFATLELSREIESNKEVQARAHSLAEKLSISGSDYKSNILLLRLKIEAQLRELAALNELHLRNPGSISFLTRELDRRGLLDSKVSALIRDITPAMNRELHEADSYLTKEEFELLQHGALSVIASLDFVMEAMGN